MSEVCETQFFFSSLISSLTKIKDLHGFMAFFRTLKELRVSELFRIK